VDDEPRSSGPATGADPGPAAADWDGWFAGGYDVAHDEYLAALTHSDDREVVATFDPADADNAAERDWADLVDQVESERAVGVTEYSVDQAAQRLTALAGTGEHAREQVEAWRIGLEGPPVLEPGELYAIATRMTGQDGHDPVGRLNAARVTGALVSQARHAENPAARAALFEEAATFARYVREAQDPAEDAEIERTWLRDDPAWWAPTGPDEVALSHHEVAAELTGRGFTPEQARAAISEYLDEASDRIGISVHQWAMDSHDIAAIAHTHRPPVPVPEQRHPSTAEPTATVNPTPTCGDAPPDHADERDDWEQVGGDDPRSYEQMMGDAAHTLTTHRPDRPTDDERREQLVRWHTDDTATGPDRGADGDDIGSDWDDEPMVFEGHPW
jgi:hypothetical protein